MVSSVCVCDTFSKVFCVWWWKEGRKKKIGIHTIPSFPALCVVTSFIFSDWRFFREISRWEYIYIFLYYIRLCLKSHDAIPYVPSIFRVNSFSSVKVIFELSVISTRKQGKKERRRMIISMPSTFFFKVEVTKLMSKVKQD